MIGKNINETLYTLLIGIFCNLKGKLRKSLVGEKL